ncbi:DUF924-domain-containing protein [Pyrenochaeta sp. DS3sAY3a]|nr:DUF924-domain-containing protein [Pyrenochaeta sp. DS3sAY3a]
MSSTSPFTLDPAIFNSSLYTRLTDVWFPGLDTSGQALNQETMRRWFMGSPDERAQFDGVCRQEFAHALDAISPAAFPNPTAAPFLSELERVAAASKDGAQSEKVAWTALSLILLLDQIPRNIFRDNAGLRKVYTHYDTMAFSLSSTLLSDSSPIPRPDIHPVFRLSGPHRLWFYMPLMHSEALADHDRVDALLEPYRAECAELEGYEGTKAFLEGQTKAEKEHREILERFGRYPHRNEALGRDSTDEEKRFLDEGGATFGVGQGKKAAKDEL